MKDSEKAVAKQKEHLSKKPVKPTPSRAASKVFPKNPPPKGVMFPFLPQPESAGRYGKVLFSFLLHTYVDVEYLLFTICGLCENFLDFPVSIRTDKAGQIGMVRVDQGKPKFPGWLIELSDKEVHYIFYC